jgi:drug/metabolite transporter (DMT)-like permease
LILSDNARGVLAMSISMAAFTLNDAMVKLVTQTLPLMQAITIRGVLCILGLLVLGRIMGGLSFRILPRDRKLLAWRTLAEVGGTLTFLGALTQMPLANLSAIMQALPLAVTLAAALFMGEKVGWRRMSAICVGFVGVLMIVRPGTDGFDVWSLVGLLAVAFVVLRDLTTRAFAAALPSVLVALWSAVAVTAMGVAGVVASGEWLPVAPWDAVRLVISSSALILGYVFSVQAMRHGDVALVAPFRYTMLVWAILFGWLLFGTLPDGWTWAGAGLVVASGLFTLWRERRLVRG